MEADRKHILVTERSSSEQISGDVLTAEGIRACMSSHAPIVVYDSLASTNDECRRLAQEGATAFTTVIANFQTNGRGRWGRTFSSPPGTGVYLSMMLKPNLSIQGALEATCLSSVATCYALNSLGCSDAGIKWVNDVYRRNKKVCGILCEGQYNTVSQKLAYLIAGIGVNVYQPAGGFQEELADKATAAFDTITEGLRNKLAARIIDEMVRCSELSSEAILHEYRTLSIMPGKDINVVQDTGIEQPAHALGIADNFGLEVLYANGMKDILTAGEVSISLNLA